ncbi:MAG: hypothetical protein ACYDER_17900, partial [Ktedonobacteraceae bacterium]
VRLVRSRNFSSFWLTSVYLNPLIDSLLSLVFPQYTINRNKVYISTSTLLWLNSWRNIYFAFQMKRATLQLPAPDNHLPTVTRPLPAISFPFPAEPQYSEDAPQAPVSSTSFTYHIVPSITSKGRSFPLTALPRYDRTIFLLINGRRTITDLAQLIKRSPAEIYASLTRLQKQQLIVME